MRPYPDQPARTKRRAGATLAAALLVGLGLGGCVGSDTTGSIGVATALPASPVALRAYADDWGRRHDADPGDVAAAVNYARALRGLTQYAQAAAVLEATAIKHPYDRAVLSAYGKALADCGRLREAAEVLERAHTPEHPDWTVLSAQGSVADQMGDHANAIGYYQSALKIAPGEPAVMSNLGLSYALSKQLPEAEATLRQAAGNTRADIRIRQNLALVLSLEGKFAEAESVARQDLAPGEAAASVAAIRAMIAQSDSWTAIKRRARQPATDGQAVH